MKRIWENIMGWFRRITYGSYGMDELSNRLYKIGMIIFIASIFPLLNWLYPIGLALLLWAMFRCFSKNHAKRSAEREGYMKLKSRMERWSSLQKRKFSDRKTHKYFKCPHCGTYNRIPKGHGKIQITCPKCRTQFERKS